MANQQDLEDEQGHVDRAYRSLENMRRAASELLGSVIDQSSGGTHQARAERDIVVRTSLHRLEQLQIGTEALCFGRIDHTTGDSFHIGRLAISNEEQEPLVVDWRAPIAEPFYRATSRERMGLLRRRHFSTQGRRITSIEDEVFTDDAFDGDTAINDDEKHVGHETLLAALDRDRSSRMRDIVATVQREQDEIIRAPLHGVLVVQGGPGTGKTAVALHRAAYLLYTHRFPLERQGLLVVGPNPVFLRYIEHVLPSLGETGVHMSTVAGLYGKLDVRGADLPLAEQVKGAARMVKVLVAALHDRQRPLREAISIPYGSYQLELRPSDTSRIVSWLRKRPQQHNVRRRQFELAITEVLRGRLEGRLGRSQRLGHRSEDNNEVISVKELWSEIKHDPTLTEALNRMWPLLRPEELLHDLYGSHALLRSAASSILSEDEWRAMYRRRSLSFDDIEWTVADLALLDEARLMIGHRKKNMPDEVMRYGHVIIDESQDLTPMQLRMVGRRTISNSMTIVGDIGQATGAHAPQRWDQVTHNLAPSAEPRLVELSINYRTPREVMELAAKVLAVAAPTLIAPQSVRSLGEEPVIVRCDGYLQLLDEVLLRATEMLEKTNGTLAVICPVRMRSMLLDRFDAAQLHSGDADNIDASVSVLSMTMSKGLEFDAVIVVEPAELVAEFETGLQALYVAMTRTTKWLAIIHSAALPVDLG